MISRSTICTSSANCGIVVRTICSQCSIYVQLGFIENFVASISRCGAGGKYYDVLCAYQRLDDGLLAS